MGELRIEPLWPEDLDSPAYRELISSRFGSDAWPKHRQYYRWLFEQTPTREAGQPLSVFVARDGEHLAGHRAVIVSDIAVDGQRLRGGWGVDLFVLDRYQGKQLGARLLRADGQTYPLGLSLGQTQAGLGHATSHGYRDAGSLVRYTRLLRPLRSVTKRLLGKIGLPRVATSLLGFPAVHTKRATYDIAVETVTSFTDRLEDGRDLRGERPSRAGVCRTAAFMQWRYLSNPLARYEVRRCSLGRHGEAYTVWRVFDDDLWRRGVLVDLVYPDAVPSSMLRLVVAVVQECLRDAGVEVFQCQTSDVQLINALDRPVLSRRAPGLRFLYRLNDERVQIPTTIDRWWLNLGDCDVDTAPLRRSHAHEG